METIFFGGHVGDLFESVAGGIEGLERGLALHIEPGKFVAAEVEVPEAICMGEVDLGRSVAGEVEVCDVLEVEDVGAPETFAREAE